MKKAETLDQEKVISAAIMLADKDGVDALSMRRLGEFLNVEAMSLYNHVESKSDLTSGMVDRIVGEIGLPSDQIDWQKSFRSDAINVRATLRRHPWAALMIQTEVSPSPIRLRRAEALIGILRHAGFSIDLAYRAQMAITTYVYGFVQEETCRPFSAVEQGDLATSLSQYVSQTDYPNLVEMLNWIAETRSHDSGGEDAHEEDFLLGLDLLLSGFEDKRTKSSSDSKELTP